MATQYRTYGFAQFGEVVLLADKACAARLQAQAGKVFVVLCGQDQNRHFVAILAQAADDFQAAQAWQGQVENQQVRGQVTGLPQRSDAVIRLGDDLLPLGFEQLAYSVANQRLLIGDDDRVHLAHPCTPWDSVARSQVSRRRSWALSSS
ncbi:hypothetical protein D3C76_414750 [compost metagenome]